jgi:hypothetical protein
MSIKIKFSFDELRRRAAKMLDVHPNYIDNVCPSEGGTKFYVVYRNSKSSNYYRQTLGATFTIWQFVEAMPIENLTGSVETFWDKGIDSVLAVLGLDKFPNSEREIKSAYRKQAKLHHPDTGGDANKFRQVQMAYETAINLLPELRRANNQH